jgi:hypothetical protein
MGRPSSLLASVAALQGQRIDSGVRQPDFAMLGRNRAKLPIPDPLFNLVKCATQLEKVLGLQALGHLDDFCDA